MTQLVLNISARQLDNKINYVKPIQLNVLNENKTTFPSINEINFLVKTAQKEVKSSKKQAKRFIKVAIGVLTTSVSILALVDPTFAATTIPVTTETPNMINPSDIMKLCKYLLGICVIISFGIAMVMSVIASSLGYFRKTDKSFKWVIEIVKSFVMVMLAPTIIITIAIVAYLLFGSSEWFIKPF